MKEKINEKLNKERPITQETSKSSLDTLRENTIRDSDREKVEYIKRLDKKTKIFRTIFVLTLSILFFGGAYWILISTGALNEITAEGIRAFILSGGAFSRVLFFILQFLQVTFLPIPSIITTLAGALVFGPYETMLISFFAILLGSLFAFWLGKKFGKKVLIWMIGHEDAEKWAEILTQGEYSFFLMMLLPIFPDDILCMVAGVTNMSYRFFIITNLISRPLAISTTCLFASGYLIPYEGWGLIVWGIILVIMTVAIILCFRYKNNIENWIKRRGREIKKQEIARKRLLKQQKRAEKIKKGELLIKED